MEQRSRRIHRAAQRHHDRGRRPSASRHQPGGLLRRDDRRDRRRVARRGHVLIPQRLSREAAQVVDPGTLPKRAVSGRSCGRRGGVRSVSVARSSFRNELKMDLCRRRSLSDERLLSESIAMPAWGLSWGPGVFVGPGAGPRSVAASNDGPLGRSAQINSSAGTASERVAPQFIRPTGQNDHSPCPYFKRRMTAPECQ